MKKIFFVFALICFGALFTDAQTITDDEDVQSWNDVQLTVPMSKKFDFYTAITMRFGKNVTRLILTLISHFSFRLHFLFQRIESFLRFDDFRRLRKLFDNLAPARAVVMK